MINILLKKLKDISMAKGSFFSDKSYKYDTIFFITNYLYNYIDGDTLDLDVDAQNAIVDKITAAFSLPSNSRNANKNFLTETLNFLSYTGAIEKLTQTSYKVKDKFQLDFITVSIENAYIYQYLVAYKTFVNDNLWNLYVMYLNANVMQEKEEILSQIKEIIFNTASSIGTPNTVWALNFVKFPMMVLGLANSDFTLTRGLKIGNNIIEPKDLSANVEGTRSSSKKDNFYIHDFRLDYVKEFLRDILAKKLVVDERNRLSGGENIIIYGVPGAGKSYTIERYYKDENTEMQRLVFHPDYTYSDFVGQILPQSKDGDVTYEFIPGPFTKILKYAHYNPEQKFILVIEEINRGNAPAIFGDVFQLLDREKDGRSSYEIANADIAKIVYDDENHPVYLPSNLSIICTMNTSDQNVFTLDTAFQRRWNMRLIENKFKKDTPEEKAFAEHPILDSDIKWEAFCETINAQILDKNQNMTSAEDKRLGTHFVTIDDLIYDENERNDNISDAERTKATLNNRRFPEKVIKYLWDDAFKFYRDEIFKGEYNSLEKVIHEFTTKSGNDRFNIFKDNIKAAIEEANTRS